MLITHLINFIYRLFNNAESQTYGSSLERFIVSKNPQSTYDVEYWTRRFDERVSSRRTAEWPL